MGVVSIAKGIVKTSLHLIWFALFFRSADNEGKPEKRRG